MLPLLQLLLSHHRSVHHSVFLSYISALSLATLTLYITQSFNTVTIHYPPDNNCARHFIWVLESKGHLDQCL